MFLGTNGAQMPYETGLKIMRVNSLEVGMYNTIQGAIDAAPEVSEIEIMNEVEHDETLTLTTSKVTLRGVGARHSVRITSVGAGSTGLTVNGAYDVLLDNLNISGRTTGAGLKLTGQIRRFHAKNCRFAGGANAVVLEASSGGQIVDVTFENCIFDGTNGVVWTTGGGDPCNKARFIDCIWEAVSGVCVLNSGGASMVRDLVMVRPIFNRTDGTEPSLYIDIDDTGDTGIIVDPFFPTSVFASAKVAIDTGISILGWKTEREVESTDGGTNGRPD